MKFLKCLKNRIILFFTLILFITLIPYGIFYIINNNTSDYKLSFSYDKTVLTENLITKDNLNLVKENLGEEYTYLNIDKITDNIKISENDNTYYVIVHKKLFNKKAQSKKFLTSVVSNTNIIGDTNVSIGTFETLSYINLNKVLIISLVSSLIFTISLFILLYFFKQDFYNLHIEYDNINLFRFVVHKNYWTNQLKELKKLKSLVNLAILFALMKVLGFITLPSGFSNLGIGLSYLVFSVIGMIYGPLIGFLVGALSDILGFFMGQSGNVFHVGYTLNAALAGFSYGICLYKTNISFSKCFSSRVFVNLFVNVVLGSIWWGQVSSFTSEQTLNYMLIMSLPKNLFYLIPQSLLMYLLIKALVKPLSISNIINNKQAETIRFL